MLLHVISRTAMAGRTDQAPPQKKMRLDHPADHSATGDCHIPPPATLLTLPVEVRLLIYEALFQDVVAPLPNPFAPLPQHNRRVTVPRLRDMLALFLASRQIYAEAQPLYIKEWLPRTTFYFDEIIKFCDFKQRAVIDHPLLARSRFYLRASSQASYSNRHILQRVAKHPCHTVPEDLSQYQQQKAGARECWIETLAQSGFSREDRPQNLPFQHLPSESCGCAGERPGCPSSRNLTVPLANGLQLLIDSHNVISYPSERDGSPDSPYTMRSVMPWEQGSFALEGPISSLLTSINECDFFDEVWNTRRGYAQYVSQHTTEQVCTLVDCPYSEIHLDISREHNFMWSAMEENEIVVMDQGFARIVLAEAEAE